MDRLQLYVYIYITQIRAERREDEERVELSWESKNYYHKGHRKFQFQIRINLIPAVSSGYRDNLSFDSWDALLGFS